MSDRTPRQHQRCIEGLVKVARKTGPSFGEAAGLSPASGAELILLAEEAAAYLGTIADRYEARQRGGTS